VHQESVILENLSNDKLLGKLSAEEAVAKGDADEDTFEAPPIGSVLNLYDIEQIAHMSMKDTSWGYYSTGSMDEFTKCAVPLFARVTEMADLWQ
jgi:hypothetical protein